MKCKKHPADVSSFVGVCATCLRERLFILIEAQLQAQTARDDSRFSDGNPPPLIFPRSVSPYTSCRKSDTAAANTNSTTATWHQQHHQQGNQYQQSNLSLAGEKFFSTPQVGPTGAMIDHKKNKNKFSLISNLFRSKPENLDVDLDSDSDPTRVSDSRHSSSSSPVWLSAILPGLRKKQIRTFSLDEPAIKPHCRLGRRRDRGMSPAFHSDDEAENNEHCNAGSSGYSSELSQGWKQTPRRTPAVARRGAAKSSHSGNMSGIGFCLSPLVRASPNRHWNQKGIPPEVVLSGGDVILPVKPRASPASFFCKNRSRKLADFGRFNPNR